MGLSFFIMLVIARQRSVDAVMGQQLLGMASVLCGYEVGFLEDAQPTQRYIFKVTDRGSNDIKYPTHCPCPLGNRHQALGNSKEGASISCGLILPVACCLLPIASFISPNPSRSGNPGRWC